MITKTGTVRGDQGVVRATLTGSCAVCGDHQTFLDVGAADRVDHRCGTAAMGGTWWLSKAAPGRTRRRRAAA